MTGFSKFLKTDPKKYSLRTKTIIFCFIMLPIIFFCVLMAVETYIRGSKSFEDLTHITGVISKERYLKHLHNSTKYRDAYYESVLVFSIQGCTDEFGFTENDKSYPDLQRVHFGNNQTIADIYYDKSGQRIEDNVTLHTFDLKIDNDRYIKIEDIQSTEMTASFVLSWIAIILSWLTYLGAKKIRRKGVIG